MAFMQQQITEKMDWLCIDGTQGNVLIPLTDVGTSHEAIEAMNESGNFASVQDYYDGEIWGLLIVNGYGCRLSASGYMDCTEWTVCSTPEECAEELERMYVDDYTEE